MMDSAAVARKSRPLPMSPDPRVVFVVDDAVSVCGSLELLIRYAGWQPELFASAQEFLARSRVLALLAYVSRGLRAT
jgi:hypothetical protein